MIIFKGKLTYFLTILLLSSMIFSCSKTNKSVSGSSRRYDKQLENASDDFRDGWNAGCEKLVLQLQVIPFISHCIE